MTFSLDIQDDQNSCASTTGAKLLKTEISTHSISLNLRTTPLVDYNYGNYYDIYDVFYLL